MLTHGADVFIAGGGPAGLAAGIAAARRGFSVTVADSAHPPIDKACGEGIMPDGVAVLGGLGVDWSAVAAVPLEGIRFVDAAGEASARFSQGAGVGMRRPVLHSMLAAAAARAGVQLAWGTRVEAVRQGEVVAGGKTIHSTYVVCADGQNSFLRPMVGLGEGKVYRRRFGFRCHYKVRPWSPLVEVYWAEREQAYVTPVGAEEVCVAFISAEQHVRLDEALGSFPELQKRLAGHALNSRTMGAVTVTRRLKAVTCGRVALLGDASGSADAITGDGLSLAFQQATALADAMACGDLGEYQKKHESISSLPRNMGELMLMMDGSARLRRRIFRAFARSPEMFEKLLLVHTRAISPLQIGVSDGLRFAWNVLRG